MSNTAQNRRTRVGLALLFAALSFATCGAVAWVAHGLAQNGSPAKPARAPVAAIAVARPQAASSPANPAPAHVDAAPEAIAQAFTVTVPEPMERFHADVEAALAHRLAAVNPQLQTYFDRDPAKLSDANYQRFVFQFLDQADKAEGQERAAMLLAGDILAAKLSCPTEDDTQHYCDDLRSNFALHHLTMRLSELDGGSYYQHDLLWRVWREYPATEWGERAVVLLLDSGWDTSMTCANGADQFRAVIKQGEPLLNAAKPTPYRPVILHLLGEAYATWWTLSHETGMEDYVDPKQYLEGAEDARTKAIGYFNQVQQLAPGTALADYAIQMVPALQQRLVLKDFRFFCIYD